MAHSSSRTINARRPLPRVVSATLRIWGALLRLCPGSFRAAYAPEVEQVFRALLLDAWRERGARGVVALWAPALADLMRGALATHMDEMGLQFEAFRRSWFMSRMRSSAILMFSAYILLVLTGIGFQKLTEDIMKTSIVTGHPGVRFSYDAIVVGAALGLLAVVAGGVPIAWASIRQALAARRFGLLALWAIPPVSLLVWLGWVWTVMNLIWTPASGITVHQSAGFWLARSVVALFILAAIVSVAAVAVAASRSAVSVTTYRFALRAATVAALGMFVTLAGVAAFALQVNAYAPTDLGGLASPILFGESTGMSLLIQIGVMLVATVIAAVSVARGLGAPAAPDEATPALA